ncbi:TetR/AcrR family transcriptional regulator [Streptomyces collinus]|uniref:TetR/AcrR family transcriptional regulator n=1 Tax=Streptomyces collinus TaxID=42684 RepID=UPI003659F77D
MAKEAGVGPGTLYWHFPARKALLAAVLQTRSEELVARQEEIARLGDADEALEQWLRALEECFSAFSGLPEPLMAAAGAQDPDKGRDAVILAIPFGVAGQLADLFASVPAETVVIDAHGTPPWPKPSERRVPRRAPRAASPSRSPAMPRKRSVWPCVWWTTPDSTPTTREHWPTPGVSSRWAPPTAPN